MRFEGWRTYSRILSYVLPYWPVLVGGVCCMLLFGATEPLLPLLLKPLLDGQGENSFLSPHWLPLLLLALVSVRGLVGFGRTYCANWLEATFQRDLRAALVRHLVDLPVSHYDNETTGMTINRITHLVGALSYSAVHSCIVLVQESTKLIGFLCVLLWLNSQLALFIIALAPLIGMIIRRSGKKIRGDTKKLNYAQGRTLEFLEETITGRKVIKAHGGEQHATERFAAVQRIFRRAFIRRGVAIALNQPVSQFILALGFALVLWQCVASLEYGTMTPGDVTVFLTTMLLLALPLRSLTNLHANLQTGIVSGQQVFALLDSPPEQDDGRVGMQRARGDLRFENVTFSYPLGDTPAVQDFSLQIRPGETLALVGRTGSGKSTLMNLLLRFYQPQQGRVLLDGVDLRDLQLSDLRHQIGLVTQDVMLFNESIAYNIAYPNPPGPLHEAIEEALRRAALQEFIKELPEGINTQAGEQGTRFSGGQRQRLSIARAFLRDSPILLLDEATSALDSNTEADIKRALRELLPGRTAIIITHRFSLIDFVDRVALIEGGHLLLVGTHQELLEKSNLYRELYEQQRLA